MEETDRFTCRADLFAFFAVALVFFPNRVETFRALISNWRAFRGARVLNCCSLPFSAASPTAVPMTPPTSAPTGPPISAPTTVPVAPAATFFRICNFLSGLRLGFIITPARRAFLDRIAFELNVTQHPCNLLIRPEPQRSWGETPRLHWLRGEVRGPRASHWDRPVHSTFVARLSSPRPSTSPSWLSTLTSTARFLRFGFAQLKLTNTLGFVTRMLRTQRG